MGILASLQNINLAFGTKVIFHNANFTINEGDRIGLIGLNGKGKSTLLKIIMGEVWPDQSTPPFICDKVKDLSITYIPQEIDLLPIQDLNTHQFYLNFYPNLLQNYRDLWKLEERLKDEYDNASLLQVQDNLLQAIQAGQGWTLAQNYEKYLKYFENFEARSLERLSGGELKKCALASGLSSESKLILWDEPTNHLDIESIEKFEESIMAKHEKSSQAFVMISHDRYLLSNICNKIIHIERGEIHMFQGNYLEYMEYLQEKEAERLKNLDKNQNKHRRELAWMRQGIKARGTRAKSRVEGFHQLESTIKDLKSRTKKIVDLSLEHTGRKSKILYEIDNGNFAYQDKTIFSDINLNVFKHDKIALIGKNGQGKTTLVNILTGSLRLTSGRLKMADQLKVRVFSQNRLTLNLEKTPLEIIGEGQDFIHLPNGSSLHINAYLERFLFESSEVRKPAKNLSGGEKNRLQLALFMKEAADLWIFDEPTNDLDIETIEILEQLLKDYESAVIIISHDRSFLDNIANKSWIIHDKTIETFAGGYTQVAPYLEALELELELKQQTPPASNSSHEVKDDAPRMNNKEKMRWKVIDQEIAKAEEALEMCTQQLATFDFQDTSAEATKLLAKLHADQSTWEDKLEKLYTEWEDLSSKKI